MSVVKTLTILITLIHLQTAQNPNQNRYKHPIQYLHSLENDQPKETLKPNIKHLLENLFDKLEQLNAIHDELSTNLVKRSDESKNREWSEWTAWSACSVTCGKGREIRWRYCTEHCDHVETEMEEKACQMPACKPAKVFGIF